MVDLVLIYSILYSKKLCKEVESKSKIMSICQFDGKLKDGRVIIRSKKGRLPLLGEGANLELAGTKDSSKDSSSDGGNQEYDPLSLTFNPDGTIRDTENSKTCLLHCAWDSIEQDSYFEYVECATKEVA